MKKIIASAMVTFVGMSAFALNSKVGTILLDGKQQQVTIEERGGSGTVTVGDQSFVITGGGNQGIDGTATEVVNGRTRKSLSLMIKFETLPQKDLQGFVNNRREVKCDSSTNSTILIGNNLNGAIFGNCLVLTNK